MTNETIESQLAHRTIRAYKDQPLTEAEVTALMDVARHTATSSFLQSCTVLHITDPQVRETIGAASGQPYVGGTKGDLFIFVADLYRNSRIRAEQGVSSEALGSINLFLTALEDALLAAQNVVVAAESMGLGTVYLGSILADPRPVVKVLQLPELTFPIVGLLVGHPDQEPGQKPRMPLSVMSAKNTYPRVESYSETLADYDREVTEYYDLRSGSRLESFTHLVAPTSAWAARTSPPSWRSSTSRACACADSPSLTRPWPPLVVTRPPGAPRPRLMSGWPGAYNERMAELGFSTYVFIERIAANAAALHPFPEHNVALVRDALADAGFDITLLGPDAPEIGEGVYFQPEPFGDEVMGLLADALTLRGIGAYAYALVDSSLGGDLADIALFTRVGDVFPRHGRHILMTRMYIQRTPTGAGNKAVTWAFGSPADLEEANRLLSEKFDTEPVTDPRGMAAIEIRHPEFAAGTAEPMVLLDEIFQVLGAAGFEGITMCNDPGQQAQG